MTKKSLSVLLDAVIIIGAHEARYFELLSNRYRLAIPATILEDEIFYFQSKDGKQGLVPSEWLRQGKVERAEADIKDHEKLSRMLSPAFMHSLDPGELEALALISSAKYKDYKFTTADRAAIKALGVLGMSDRGIAVETLLENAGASTSLIKRLPQHFTKRWFNSCLHDGFMEKQLWLKSSV